MLLTARETSNQAPPSADSLPRKLPVPSVYRGRPAPTLPATSQSSWLSGTVTVAEAKVLLPHASVTR